MEKSTFVAAGEKSPNHMLSSFFQLFHRMSHQWLPCIAASHTQVLQIPTYLHTISQIGISNHLLWFGLVWFGLGAAAKTISECSSGVA
jgi:hypothetical protein